ncbi:MAG: polysaccharide biosynthesis C-terminal domain-containing protein [Eubacterium ramulus]
MISSNFRGLGDSKSPMYFIAIACAANIGLDYLFMGAFQMGPAGAALGTTLAQALSVVIALIMILKRKMITVTRLILFHKKRRWGRLPGSVFRSLCRTD